MGGAVKMVSFIRQVLGLFQPGHKQKRVTVCDENERAINLAEPSLGSARSRHIDVRHRFLRELIAKEAIKMVK